MLNSNGKRHYCIDDIINDSKSSKRQPLGDATNYCLPDIAERKVAVAMRPDEVAGPRGERGDACGDRGDAACADSDVDLDVGSVVELLLPCRKISLRLPRGHTWWSGEETKRLAASFPDVHVFPQRPIKALDVLDAESLYDRHCDWCEAFRAAYLRGCRLYVTHSTFTAVFWADRDVAVVSRATSGFKRLLEAHGVVFDDQAATAGGRQRIVIGRPVRSATTKRTTRRGDAPSAGRTANPRGFGDFSGAAAIHALYDLIMNEVVGVGVESKRSDIFKGDFPRLYCEKPFRHSSTVVWEETLDRKRGEVVGYMPAWVLEGLLSAPGSVASFERMPDF